MPMRYLHLLVPFNLRVTLFPLQASSLMLTFDATSGDGVDDQLLNNCAKLFSENYGIWGNLVAPPLSGTFP